MSEVGQHYTSSDTFGPFRPIQAQILPDDGIEMFYQPGETLFGPVAMPMRELRTRKNWLAEPAAAIVAV